MLLLCLCYYYVFMLLCILLTVIANTYFLEFTLLLLCYYVEASFLIMDNYGRISQYIEAGPIKKDLLIYQDKHRSEAVWHNQVCLYESTYTFKLIFNLKIIISTYCDN